MSEITDAIKRIQSVAALSGGMGALAAEAGVPYSTVHSFQQRGWKHKNLETIEKLASAAKRIEARG